MEDFVPYELALKLKDKGFRKPCIATYDKDGMLGYNYVPPTSIHAVGFEECLVYSNDCVMAPTISQVLKWLREEKKIHIEVVFGSCGFCWDLILNIKYVEGYNNSEWDVLDCEKYAEINNQENHSTYEQAAIAGIEYVLYNLI